MRAVVQRVKDASVSIDDKLVSRIGAGLMVLLGISTEDTEADAIYICDKLTGLRVFDDENEVPNLSVVDIKGSILLVSQFTLYGDARKGRRPSYIHAARPELAEPLYELCKSRLCAVVPTECGMFGANMQIALVNDGPFTILIDSGRGF